MAQSESQFGVFHERLVFKLHKKGLKKRLFDYNIGLTNSRSSPKEINST